MSTMNRRAGMGLAIISLALVAFGCGSARNRVLDSPKAPDKAPTEEMIKLCDNLPETMEVKCPINVFLKGLYNFADLWEYSQKCKARLEAAESFGEVDRAELQGQVNEQASRADRNARIAWVVAAAGLVLTVVGFVVGAVAF